MSSYLELPEGTEAVAQIGARLRAQAQDFKEQARQILGDIQGLDQGQPWGNDQAGKAFAEQYHKPVEGAGSLALAMQDRLHAAGDLLDELGGTVVTAMQTVESADLTGGADIAGAV
ncbi:hypothetical protein ACWT_5729 [Actinoplanes sp. SE50]|uniref:hypothetical protein n=1 Tax=unclassified Actinoplanes TaxID=2626549 RepID=UPI00023ED4BD|nr:MULTISPECIES: hypothetical protein [unclassified Actinoplanes]AEV86747.1 hypothetical protein ACPL_5860 [Actinoplanes sp. SE50/110]ATO85144.1 hypothetical protein ACWT_5729 [Actinoplanes sp. SE50]SLM02555.1 hypothetical protein ACSP50_5805 [Actinoplanes sp. SE50/110]